MSFKSWIVGILSDALAFFLPLLKSKVAEIAADKEVQALAIAAVLEVAKLAPNNSNDDKHICATMQLRDALRAKGRDAALGICAVVIEAAFQKLKANGEVQ